MKLEMPQGAWSASKVKGKTYWYITPLLAAATAKDLSSGFQAAAEAAGAKAMIFDGRGNVTTWNQGVSEAVSQGAAGIVLQGEKPSLVSGPLADAASKHIPVIDVLNGNFTDPLDGLFAHITPNVVETGALEADYVLAKTNCSANVALFNEPVYPSLVDTANGFQAEMKRLCPTCQVDVQDVAAANLATTIPTQVENVVHSHPQINYVVSTADTMAFYMSSALKSIGSNVPVIGANGQQSNLQIIQQGSNQQADVSLPPLHYMGWLAFNEIARASLGMTNDSFVLPQQIFDKSNLQLSNPFPNFSGFESAFKKLWGVG